MQHFVSFLFLQSSRVRNIISKGPIYKFPPNIDFPKCRRDIAASLNDFGCLSGPPGFTCWISFAPVFSFIYC